MTSSDAGCTSVSMRNARADDSRKRQVTTTQERVNVQAERVQRLGAGRMREAAAEEAILHSMDDMLRKICECARDNPQDEKT